MEQFIGCDAHKKFSVFVAVNEKGQAGEALRANIDETESAACALDAPFFRPL
jgi:hypothetical protein